MIFAITYPATTLLGRGFLLASLCYVVQDKAGKKPSMGKTPLKVDIRWCKALRMWAPGQTDSSLHLKSLDPRRLMQSKGPERGSPLPREPRKATPSQHGTSQSFPSNLSLVALSGAQGGLGLTMLNSRSPRESAGGRSSQGKRWHLEPALLGAALSTQFLLQEQDPRLEGTQLDGFHIPNQFNKQQPNVKAAIVHSPD